MPRITTHEHFVACLDAYLKQVGIDTGFAQPKDRNMLQFVIGLGAGVGPTDYRTGAPIRMEFKPSLESPMKTIIHVLEPGFTNTQADRIADYFNRQHGAQVAKVLNVAYLKGKHENIEVFSGALADELDTAKEYQEVFRGSLIAGTRIFMGLPISDAAKSELQSPAARVEFVPYAKAGHRQHAIEFSGISDAAQAEILSAINVQYGEGSVNYA
jgi:hypothetical protein